MKHQTLCLYTCLLLLFLAPTSWADLTEEGSATHPLGSQGRISLENINGNVTIESWQRNEVEIRWTISAESQHGLDRVEVQIDTRSESVSIDTDYSRQKSKWRGDSASVEFWLKVPVGARLSEISLINGSLKLTDLAGNIDASLVNGKLRASGLSGDVELSTVNGSIEVSFDRLGGSQRVDLDSVNGSLEIRIPRNSDAEIEASTVHGRIRNDFGLEVDKGRYVGSDLKGTLGNGSARVELDNVNGSIDIEAN